MRLHLNGLILVLMAWQGLGQSKPATHAGHQRIGVEATVDVYLSDETDREDLVYGKSLATEIFKRIGVRVNWHRGRLPTTAGAGRDGALRPAFGILTADHAPRTVGDLALASSRIMDSRGVEITVYKDRLRGFLVDHPRLRHVASGYILAHELAHVMQAVARHSDSGILTAQWTSLDYSDMIYHTLVFTESDIELIHKGLASQMAHSPSFDDAGVR